MKILILAVALAVVGVVGGVRADLTVVQSVTGLGQDTENLAKFKDGKTRVDTSPGTSLIMNQKSGEMINLMHGPKTYVKISDVMAQATVDSLKAGSGTSPVGGAPKAVLTATGKTETVAGFPAEEYRSSVAGVKMSIWLTRALPDYAVALKEMSNALTQGPMGPLLQSYGLDMAALPGFPVRTVLEIAPGQTMTSTVISLNTQPVPDSEFEIPPGYKEVSVPVLTPPAAAQPAPSLSR